MTYDYYIHMFGQSNSVGFCTANSAGGGTQNSSGTDLGMGYTVAFPACQFNQTSSTAPSSPQTFSIITGTIALQPYQASGLNMGCEASIGRDAIKYGLCSAPYIRKDAIGSSSIPGTWAPGAYPPSGTKDYTQLVTNVNAGIAEAGRPPDLWVHQIGETDAGTPGRVLSAVSDLTAFYAALRTDIPALVGMPIVCVMLNPDSTFGDNTNYRAQQLLWAAADPTVIVVDSAGIPLRSDPHYGPCEYGSLGTRIVFAALQKLFPTRNRNLGVGPIPFYQGDDSLFTTQAAPLYAAPRAQAGEADGDLQLMIATSYTDAITHSLTLASGFTQIGTQVDSVVTTTHRATSMYYRVVTQAALDANGGYLPAPRLTFGTANKNFAKIFTFKNVDRTNPILSFSTGVNNANNTSLTIAGGTASMPNSMAAIFMMTAGTTNSVTSITNASLSNISIKRDSLTNPGSGTVGVALATATIPGSTYNSTAVTFNNTGVNVGWVVVLQAAIVSGTSNVTLSGSTVQTQGTATFPSATGTSTVVLDSSRGQTAGTITSIANGTTASTLGSTTGQTIGKVLLAATTSATLAGTSGTTVANALITATSASKLGGTTGQFFGTSTGTIQGNAAIALAADTVVGTGSVTVTGTADIALASDTVDGTASVTATGSAAIIIPGDTVSGSLSVVLTGVGAITCDDDTVFGGAAPMVKLRHPYGPAPSTFVLKQGDLEPQLVISLIDSGGVPIDVTASTSITFRMAPANTRVELFSREATVISPTVGEVSYVWHEGDTDLPDVYYGEFIVEWPGPRTQTYPADGYLVISIEPKL